ncbi:F0F1 ATP synthase subunit alpha [Candidatus Dependentiae bacterium]|nr:F0F1 ATP synthase subunit alpha [Candidatus Dependentiae bacterium]
MIEKETDIISLLEKSLRPDEYASFEEVGVVIKIGDGICKVHGLNNAVFGEIVIFESGTRGIILDLDEDFVSVILLESQTSVIEQEVVKRTGKVLKVPVGEELIGRVINAVGKPVDQLGPLEGLNFEPIERVAPGITEREPIHESLETGITTIDALIPIGKGQRELLIGNRSTGKTTIVLDTILHQKNKNVICIYVAIGHKQAHTARMIQELESYGAMEYTIIVDADANETALNQYLSPYTGCTIGEFFMRRGQDALVIYDDLSNHAIAYRELSLLLRRPPGREAYPGDIFYIHSRLLERAGKVLPKYGGGSLTALPIVQTQGDDISAYIPTNLISITDGQIVLDTQLFNAGIRPAINIGLSVSRVSGAAQTKAIKKVAGSLKLELAQYNELLAFEQFGSELDKVSQRAIDRGKRAIELLKQPEHETYSFVDQTIFLFLLKENFLDKLAMTDVKPFAVQCASYIKGAYTDTYQSILQTMQFNDQHITDVRKAAGEFALIFIHSR